MNKDRQPLRLRIDFESGHLEAGEIIDGEWYLSFYTDSKGSYMAADVHEKTLRALLAFIDTVRA